MFKIEKISSLYIDVIHYDMEEINENDIAAILEEAMSDDTSFQTLIYGR